MHRLYLEEEIEYDGSQLSSLWIYRCTGCRGDAIVSFCGPCRVEPEKGMVDLEDVLAGEGIFSPSMLHFIAEFFETDLEKGVLRQRTLIHIIREAIYNTAGKWVERDGDDLYWQGRKLSVSIATASPVSTLIHTGLNISAEGTPVPAAALPEVGIEDIPAFAAAVMEAFAREMEGIKEARCKVKWVP